MTAALFQLTSALALARGSRDDLLSHLDRARADVQAAQDPAACHALRTLLPSRIAHLAALTDTYREELKRLDAEINRLGRALTDALADQQAAQDHQSAEQRIAAGCFQSELDRLMKGDH